MGTLYLSRIMPNSFGKDASYGHTTNAKLNEEWVEVMATGGDRNLTGDMLLHRTYTSYGCTITGVDPLITLSGTLSEGQSLRLHTGSGQSYRDGPVHHLFLGRSWFVWNNACGDEARLQFQGNDIDWAQYGPNPPERVLVRAPGTHYFN